MESFNAVPEPVIPEVPDESQRVGDVAKAQEMASDSNEMRSWAARNREAAKQEQNPNVKEFHESGARLHDKDAEYYEKRAAEEHDLIQKNKE